MLTCLQTRFILVSDCDGIAVFSCLLACTCVLTRLGLILRICNDFKLILHALQKKIVEKENKTMSDGVSIGVFFVGNIEDWFKCGLNGKILIMTTFEDSFYSNGLHLSLSCNTVPCLHSFKSCFHRFLPSVRTLRTLFPSSCTG